MSKAKLADHFAHAIQCNQFEDRCGCYLYLHNSELEMLAKLLRSVMAYGPKRLMDEVDSALRCRVCGSTALESCGNAEFGSTPPRVEVYARRCLRCGAMNPPLEDDGSSIPAKDQENA